MGGTNVELNSKGTVSDPAIRLMSGLQGSGKTTFSKQLNAILRPSEGTVTVDEMGTRDAEKLYEIRQRVGMVF